MVTVVVVPHAVIMPDLSIRAQAAAGFDLASETKGIARCLPLPPQPAVNIYGHQDERADNKHEQRHILKRREAIIFFTYVHHCLSLPNHSVPAQGTNFMSIFVLDAFNEYSAHT